MLQGLDPGPAQPYSGKGTTSAEDSQRKPTQSHVLPSIQVHEDTPKPAYVVEVTTVSFLLIVFGLYNSKSTQKYSGYVSPWYPE